MLYLSSLSYSQAILWLSIYLSIQVELYLLLLAGESFIWFIKSILKSVSCTWLSSGRSFSYLVGCDLPLGSKLPWKLTADLLTGLSGFYTKTDLNLFRCCYRLFEMFPNDPWVLFISATIVGESSAIPDLRQLLSFSGASLFWLFNWSVFSFSLYSSDPLIAYYCSCWCIFFTTLTPKFYFSFVRKSYYLCSLSTSPLMYFVTGFKSTLVLSFSFWLFIFVVTGYFSGKIDLSFAVLPPGDVTIGVGN